MDPALDASNAVDGDVVLFKDPEDTVREQCRGRSRRPVPARCERVIEARTVLGRRSPHNRLVLHQQRGCGPGHVGCRLQHLPPTCKSAENNANPYARWTHYAGTEPTNGAICRLTSHARDFSASGSMTDMPATVGRFEIVRLPGRGRHGRGLSRHAIRRSTGNRHQISRRWIDDKEMRQWFAREARAADSTCATASASEWSHDAGSSRSFRRGWVRRALPGKILKPLAGKPAGCSGILSPARTLPANVATIVIATDSGPPGRRGREFLSRDERRLLSAATNLMCSIRYLSGSRAVRRGFQLLRITDDCPVIDPVLVDDSSADTSAIATDVYGLGGEFPDGLDWRPVFAERAGTSWREATFPTKENMFNRTWTSTLRYFASAF